MQKFSNQIKTHEEHFTRHILRNADFLYGDIRISSPINKAILELILRRDNVKELLKYSDTLKKEKIGSKNKFDKVVDLLLKNSRINSAQDLLILLKDKLNIEQLKRTVSSFLSILKESIEPKNTIPMLEFILLKSDLKDRKDAISLISKKIGEFTELYPSSSIKRLIDALYVSVCDVESILYKEKVESPFTEMESIIEKTSKILLNVEYVGKFESNEGIHLLMKGGETAKELLLKLISNGTIDFMEADADILAYLNEESNGKTTTTTELLRRQNFIV